MEEDAVLVDTTALSLEQSEEKIAGIIEKRLAGEAK